LHLTQDGGYFTGPDSKKLRMQLVKADQQQQGQGGGQSGAAGGLSGQQVGQQAQYNKESKQFIEVNGSKSQHVNKQHVLTLQDNKTGIDINSDNNVYLGAVSGQGSFLPVMLADMTPSKNVFGLKGGGMIASVEDSEPVPIIVEMIKTIKELTARVEALETDLKNAGLSLRPTS
jgi:hypothetical protein